MIIASSKTVKCHFDRSVGGREYYTGTIEKLGLDVGFTGKGVMSWVVFAPGKISKGALAGKYAGASASASVAVGLGANVLVGGGNKSIALQPLSRPGPDRPEHRSRRRRAEPEVRQEGLILTDHPRRGLAETPGPFRF